MFEGQWKDEIRGRGLKIRCDEIYIEVFGNMRGHRRGTRCGI